VVNDDLPRVAQPYVDCPRYPRSWRPRAPGPDDPVLVAEHRGLDAVTHPQFSEHAGDVAFHGRLAEVEPGRDLGVRQPARHKMDDAGLVPHELRVPCCTLT